MPAFVSRYVCLALFLALAPASTSAQPDAQRAGPLGHGQAEELRTRTFDRLLDRASRESSVRVIVGLGVPFRPEAELSPAETTRQRQAFTEAQETVVTALAAPEDVTRYATIPYVALEVGRADLARLQASSLVVSVVEDVPVPPTTLPAVLPSSPSMPLQESVPLIGADVAWEQGISGAGWSVAVLDTGVDSGHPFLAGKVVAEACFSTTSGSQSASVCPSGQNTQIGTGAGMSCDASVSGCDHGTHVAGIAAGTGPSFSGVARDASVIAVQVFSEFPAGSPFCSGPGPCVLSYTSDQIEGLEYVYSLRSTLDVAAANMSLGGGQYTATCDAESAPTKAAIDQLLGAGIATAIASGNNGFANSTGSPGCISTAVTVGSTTKTDGLSSFSNTAPWVDVLAPGSAIQSSVPGGGFAYFNGTSMATPHVAGAFAILRQGHPAESADELLDRLTSTGVPILAGNPSQNYPRIQVDDALGSVGGTPIIAVTPSSLSESLPVGSNSTRTLTIQNEGTADLTFEVGFVVGATAARFDPPRHLPRESVARRSAAQPPSARSSVSRVPTRSPLSPAQGNSENVSDGSFEEGTPNPFWSEASATFGTPLCDETTCGLGGGSGPFDGAWWTWFGGSTNGDVGSVEQDVEIPVGQDLLTFYLEMPSMPAPGFMNVRIDGDVVFTVDESDLGSYNTYQEVTIDVSDYADGGMHTLRFESTTTGSGNIFVDDVSLFSEPSSPSWLTVAPTEGTVTPEGSAPVTLTFDATGLEAGTYSTTLAVSSNDANAPVVEVPVTFTVSAVNQPPVAADDDAETEEGSPVTLDVLANDSDPDGDVLTVAEVSTPTHGGAVDNGDGSITYTPAAGFTGEDVFTYIVSDGNGESDEATVTVSVRAIHPDSLALIALYDATDGSNWTNNANWLSGPIGTWHGVTVDAEGRVSQLQLNENGLNGTLPAEIEQLAQLTSLGLGDNNLTGTIPAEIGQLANLTALDLNGNQLDGELPAEIGNLASLESLVINDNPLTGPLPLSFVGLTALTTFHFAGTELCVPDDPALQAWLDDVFDVIGTDVACFTNQPPMAADDAATTDEDLPLTIDVLANDEDPDGDALSVTAVSSPDHGTAEVDSEGRVIYSPELDFFGTDAFTYTVSDGLGGESIATVTASVDPVNDAPTAASITLPENGSTVELTGDPEATVAVSWTAAADVEGDAVSYRWEAILDGGDFAEPFLTIETDAPTFETTYGALDAALVEAGVGAGEDAVVDHRVVASDGQAETAGSAASVTFSRGVLTNAESRPLPTTFATLGAYPNPSAGSPRIAVDLPWAAEVTVEVFDTVGRHVATSKERHEAGRGQDIPLNSLALPTGVYVYRLTATAPTGSEVATGHFTVVR